MLPETYCLLPLLSSSLFPWYLLWFCLVRKIIFSQSVKLRSSCEEKGEVDQRLLSLWAAQCKMFQAGRPERGRDAELTELTSQDTPHKSQFLSKRWLMEQRTGGQGMGSDFFSDIISRWYKKSTVGNRFKIDKDTTLCNSYINSV